MNKEIIKRKSLALAPLSIPVEHIPSITKKPKKPRDPKTIVRLFMFLVLVIEAVKNLTLLESKGHDIRGFGGAAIGSICLIIIYLALGACVHKDSKASLKYLREFLLAVAVLVFLVFELNALVEIFGGDTDSYAFGLYLVSASGFLLTAMNVQDLLGDNIVAKTLPVIGFFLLSCIKNDTKSDVDAKITYLNTLFPLAYILLLLAYRYYTYGNKAVPMLTSSSPAKESKHADLSYYTEEALFFHDKQGNITQKSGFFMKDFNDNKSPDELFRRIKDIEYVRSEPFFAKLKDANGLGDQLSAVFSSDNLFAPDSSSPRKLSRLIGLDESESGTEIKQNLDVVVKTLYYRVTGDESSQPKILHYRGIISEGNDSNNYVAIRIFTEPKGEHPLVIAIKDETVSYKYEELKNFTKSRESMLNKLAIEMNTVMESSKELINSCSKEVEQKKSIKEIKKELATHTQASLNPMLMFIWDIMDFCTIKRSKLKFTCTSVNLDKVLERAINPFKNQAKAKNIDLSFEILKDPISDYIVVSDERRIMQVLYKLLSNAIKHTTKGSIKLTLKAFYDGFIITVKDTGVGIVAEELEKIKEDLGRCETDSLKAFHSRCSKKRGLAIAHMFAYNLGPRITSGLSIKSIPGEGTTITFNLSDRNEEDDKKISTPGDMSPRRTYSPLKPSRFKRDSGFLLDGPSRKGSMDLRSDRDVELEVEDPPLSPVPLLDRCGDKGIPKSKSTAFERKISRFATHDTERRVASGECLEVANE